MKKISLLFFSIMIFWGCKKEIADIPRNNPNDIHSPNYIPPQPKIIFSKWGSNPIHAGDNVNLAIWLKNIGIGSAFGVKANIKTNSSYLNVNNFGSYQFDNMDNGTEGLGHHMFNTDGWTIEFVVSNSAPVGTILTFNLDISASSNYNLSDSLHFSDSFKIIVQ